MKWTSSTNSYSRSRVVWTGAGFSHSVTCGSLPLMKGFFDKLTESEYPNLHRVMRKKCSNLVDANVEELLECFDREYALPVSRGGAHRLGIECDLPSARFELSRYCVERLAYNGPQCNEWVAELFISIAAGATTITTNYDTVSDRLLSHMSHEMNQRISCPHCIMRRLLEYGCSCGPTEPVKRDEWQGSLLKLHGSIAWRVCRNTNCDTFNCLSPDQHCRPVSELWCECCDEACESCLIYPTRLKRYDSFSELHRMWDAAGDALASAVEIIFFGYSIPESDDAIRTLLRSALARNTQIGKVWIIDARPEPVKNRLLDLLDDPSRIEIDVLVVPDRGIPAWWNRRLSCLTDLVDLKTISD